MLRFTTAGESHGPAVLAVLEGLPAGLALTPDDIDCELARRQLGHGRGAEGLAQMRGQPRGLGRGPGREAGLERGPETVGRNGWQVWVMRRVRP